MATSHSPRLGLRENAAQFTLLVAVNALVGGMIAAQWELGITHSLFLLRLPEAVPIANLWLGLGKSIVLLFAPVEAALLGTRAQQIGKRRACGASIGKPAAHERETSKN